MRVGVNGLRDGERSLDGRSGAAPRDPASPSRLGWRGRPGGWIPVLGDLAVDDAEHVKPGGRVSLRRILGIRILAREAQGPGDTAEGRRSPSTIYVL
jgi:hypothetical protein